MIHIRVDDCDLISQRRMACGIVGPLPEGDQYYFQSEGLSRLADCQGCNPGGPQKLGTPISQLCGRPGHNGFSEFSRIAESWGID